MPGEFRKTWLITGCSSGLGKALARHALERGDRVAAAARRAADLAEMEGDFPETCRALSLDVTDRDQVASVVGEAANFWGRLDVVVNNAGCALVGALEELDEEEIARNLEVNFLGATRVIRAFLPLLRAVRTGHIINVSAAAAIENYPGLSIYGAAKRALEGMSEALAAELRPLGGRVTIVQPGPMRTDFAGRSLTRASRRIADYETTSGKFEHLLATMDGRQTGDPVRAAAAIAAVVDSDDPPLRLVLGKYAHDKTQKAAQRAARDLAAADFNPAIEFNSHP